MCFAGSSNLWCLGRVSMHVLDICGRLPRQEVLNLVNCLQILNHFWPQRQNFAIVLGKKHMLGFDRKLATSVATTQTKSPWLANLARLSWVRKALQLKTRLMQNGPFWQIKKANPFIRVVMKHQCSLVCLSYIVSFPIFLTQFKMNAFAWWGPKHW